MPLFERPPPDLTTEGDVLKARAVAFAVDFAIVALVAVPLGVALFGRVTRIADFASIFGLFVFVVYTFAFESRYGQTVGKRVVGLVVVTEGGDPIDARTAAVRNVLRVVDGLPGILHLVALVAVLVTDRGQRVGDYLADTTVVEAKESPDQL